MVHALREAHRVLKPNGVLLDVRPGLQHRRVGIARAGRWRVLATMREPLDDDRAANRAVAHVLRTGLFRREGYLQFDLKRHLDTLEDFRAWIDEFIQLFKLPPHDWLVERVQHALAEKHGQVKIVVRGPLEIRVMKKAG